MYTVRAQWSERKANKHISPSSVSFLPPLIHTAHKKRLSNWRRVKLIWILSRPLKAFSPLCIHSHPVPVCMYKVQHTSVSALLCLSLSRFRSFDRSFSPCLSFSFSKQCSKFLIEVSHELRWLPINYKMQKLFCDSMTVSMVLLTVRVYCVTCNVCVLHITTDFLARLFSCKTKERVAWPLIGNEICYSSSSSNNANKKAARLHLQKSNISTWK